MSRPFTPDEVTDLLHGPDRPRRRTTPAAGQPRKLVATPTQAALLLHLDIGLPTKAKITQVTYNLCRDYRWTRDIDAHPYLQITPLGRFVIGHGPDPDDPHDTRTVEQCRATAATTRTHEELTDHLTVAEVAIANALRLVRVLRTQDVLTGHETDDAIEQLSNLSGRLHGVQAVADEAFTGAARP